MAVRLPQRTRPVAYRNILISPETVDQIAPLVHAARGLAATDGRCRLVGAHRSSRARVYSHGDRRDDSPSEPYDHELHERVRELSLAFHAHTEALSLPCHWRNLHGEHPDDAAALTELARCFDIAIVAGLEGSAEPARLAGRLAPEAGIPTLFLPPGHPADASAPARVLVAWDASREASRAVFRALPVLQRAARVELARFDEPEADAVARPADTARVLREQFLSSLDVHGVAPVELDLHAGGPTNAAGERGALSELLLARMHSSGCELVVLGAQGRAATSRGELARLPAALLGRSRVPVLLS